MCISTGRGAFVRLALMGDRPASAPTPAPAGAYVSSPGSSTLTPCAPGYYTDALNAIDEATRGQFFFEGNR